MCKWGTDVELLLETPAESSHTGVSYTRPWGVDACIAPLVKALNEAGIKTTQSCCGHFKGPGRIDLKDGRVLYVHGEAANL